nr:DUF4157 domain-containing protein [Gloeotrichia echinulata DEX184]
MAFGADFSGVKVHTDGQSDQLNRSIQARAFTTGQDVFFRQGEYNPGSRGGQELIAHELTHVVQQNGGAVIHLSQTNGETNGEKGQVIAPITRSVANNVAQKKTPAQGGPFKEVAVTGSYQARGGKNKMFNSRTYPRSQFNFGSKTRKEVLSQERYQAAFTES